MVSLAAPTLPPEFAELVFRGTVFAARCLQHGRL
jgi:hypothetical protein